MSSSGPNYPLTAVDDASVGTVAWSDVTNVIADDGNNATATLTNSAVSHYIKATNFGFSIPSGATIDGIVVEVEQQASSANRITDNAVRIVKGGTIGSTDRSSSSYWPTTITAATYGSSSDLWGETWSDTDINSSSFGVAISAKNTAALATIAGVDYIRVIIYYTVSSGTEYSRTLTTTAASTVSSAVFGLDFSLTATATAASTVSTPALNTSTSGTEYSRTLSATAISAVSVPVLLLDATGNEYSRTLIATVASSVNLGVLTREIWTSFSASILSATSSPILGVEVINGLSMSLFSTTSTPSLSVSEAGIPSGCSCTF